MKRLLDLGQFARYSVSGDSVHKFSLNRMTPLAATGSALVGQVED